MGIWGASENSCSFFSVREVEVNYCGVMVSVLVVVYSVSNVYCVWDETGCGETVVNSPSEFGVFFSVSVSLFVWVPVSVGVN